ncbi:TetR family transcriptional regulator [Photobacterium phosphoreum]|jgi:AcrR family transcriptional regulator|uniref:TetR family transcriptional regulator n=1 Tax=Photobacterium phosphoreum TaxID=659 RepID=A0AAW4ZX02_PHOPO|nr:TetR/AcrR family transcriptional regulator [Photobacterium phosphoreum]KJF86120.1 TetR family transcriptional regulator [Photobacterium phosphoreum]MCD9469036.1 TetR/AcrR family transcriptional regulator [Photobacterium phosphoreum]MCD9473945.1 TetR family transcriptional regulator [Photobacterium phosphoreum]MCD9477539.1 TetR family transcriptional regulator [Photobacterium phosphoreum]MCD9482139.1 TetR family transcriptional regulator [Photobacterium phosphoreum]
MRSAEFDRDQVLLSAMDVFITKGYSNTSMQDLKKATGLHPGSIYCAFNNKRGLLLAALEHYRDQRYAQFVTLFSQSSSVISAIESYLEHVVDECEREQIKDCLLQKALSELAQQDVEVADVISQMLKQWQQTLAEQLALAQQRHEINDQRDSQQLAQFLVMGIYGLRTFSHTRPEPGVIRRLAADLMAYIQQ